MPNISRRDFLKIMTQGLLGMSGILGLAGLVRFLSYEPDPPPPQRFEVGPTSHYLINTRTVIKEIPAILIHTATNYHALSLVCQHLGCTVESKADGFICPCHGSRYGLEGQLLQGPAETGLKSLRVEITPDDKIIIFKN
jgi:cytochrome b6-f complex iron-sulfur subunit